MTMLAPLVEKNPKDPARARKGLGNKSREAK